jgi:phospholipase C
MQQSVGLLKMFSGWLAAPSRARGARCNHAFVRLLTVSTLVFAVLGALPARAQISHFQHIVYIIQENRTPDNFFQGLCTPPYGSAASCSTTPGKHQYNIQTSNWLDNTSKTGVTQPVAGSLVSDFDMNHAHSGYVDLCDADPTTGICRMDGQAKNNCNPTCPMKSAKFGYVENTDGILNPYLAMVKQYGWANYMFQTNQGPSFPAHHFIFGGTSAPTTPDDAAGIFASGNPPTLKPSGCIADPGTTVPVINSSGVQFENIFPCLEHQTLPDILPPGVTWKYYAANAGGILNAPTGIGHICNATAEGGKCVGAEWTENEDLNPADVLSDIAACELRSISWVTPTTPNSDHAGGNDGGGPSWVASIVNAIGKSSSCDGNTGYWQNTAIILTWDDWGGWYDHVPPPIPAAPQNGYQYGARVPLIVISAYTLEGRVDDTMFYDFGSFLRFAEHNFGIAEGALNYADARSSTNLTSFFNLKSAPRTFKTISAPKDANFFLNDKRPITGEADDQ